MNDEKTSKAESIAKAVEKVADSKGLAEIGKGLGAGLVALAGALAFASIYFGMAATKWDGRIHPQTKCFELQEIKGEAYKVNTCTGEFEKIDSKEAQENEKSAK